MDTFWDEAFVQCVLYFGVSLSEVLPYAFGRASTVCGPLLSLKV